MEIQCDHLIVGGHVPTADRTGSDVNYALGLHRKS